ncbi:MAG: L,D-transpeptidase family protein [Candidatus Zixiibacteriota bacterium]
MRPRMTPGKKRWIFAISILLPLLPAVAWMAALHYRTPPLGSLHRAYRAIDRARLAGAEKHAQAKLHDAELFLKLGEDALQAENASWHPFGSYRFADSLLTLAAVKAGIAREATTDIKEAARDEVSKALSATEREIDGWRRRLDSGLAPMDCQHLLTAASTSLNLARDLTVRNQHHEAESLLQTTDSLIERLASHYERYQTQNEENLRHWNANVRRTKEHSRKTGEPAIIVDKTAHKLYLILKGEVAAIYPCDLGYKSAVQKRVSGDGATPEGMYRVTEIKRYSKYYRALLLNYPNESDRQRFRQAQRDGTISKRARIGGLIEIHGDGGQGKDWTDGCVAVTNEQMDKLLKYAVKGMWVTIVRMTEPLP